MYIEWIVYALIGAVSGFLAGLLGIGGGVIAVPALFFCMGYFGIAELHLMHVTIATSLASMIFSTLSATIAHQKRKAIYWNMAMRMLVGLIIGSALGAYIAQLLSTQILSLIFGVFLLLVAIRFFIPESLHSQTHNYIQPKFLTCNLMGFSISSVAALLGIGGGLFTVPLLTASKMRLKNAIATSSAISLLITVIGSILFFFLGLHQTQGQSLGFIYLPAFVMISLFSFVCAPLGVKAIHSMRPKSIGRVFGCVLMCIGIYMIIKSVV